MLGDFSFMKPEEIYAKLRAGVGKKPMKASAMKMASQARRQRLEL